YCCCISAGGAVCTGLPAATGGGPPGLGRGGAVKMWLIGGAAGADPPPPFFGVGGWPLWIGPLAAETLASLSDFVGVAFFRSGLPGCGGWFGVTGNCLRKGPSRVACCSAA